MNQNRYAQANKSMHQSIFVSLPTFTVTIVTMAMEKFIWLILTINRQISLVLFYFTL